MKNKIENIYHTVNEKLDVILSNNRRRWAFATVTVAVLLLFLMCSRPIFLGTGDVNMMKNYTGYRTGSLDANHPYGHVFIGWLMTTLYGVFPKLPWFSIYNIGVLFISFTTILKAFLSIAKALKKSIFTTILIFIMLYVTIFIHTLTNITYTINATILAASAISLVFSSLYEQVQSVKIIEFFLSCIYMLGCSIIRYSVFKPIVCFWLLAIVYYFIREKYNKNLKRSIVLFGFTGAMFLGAVFSHTFYMNYRQAYEPQGYYEYNKARTQFMDYYIAPYEGNEEFYNSIGWNGELYNLTDFYYFIDEAYNTENLEKILDYTKENNLKDPNTSTLYTGKMTVWLDEQGRIITLIMFALFIIIFMEFIRYFDKENILLLAGAVASMMGTIVFSFYLSYEGRFPLRTYQCVTFPTIIILTCIYLALKKSNEIQNIKLIKAGRVLSVFLSVCIVIEISNSLQMVYDWEKINQTVNSNQGSEDMCNYALAHRDNIYIYDTTVSGDYRLNIPVMNTSPTNMMMWGGTNMYNQAYYNQLKTIGKEGLSSDVWFEDNVYYITENSENNLRRENLFAFLSEKYGNVQMLEVSEINANIIVYKFMKG